MKGVPEWLIKWTCFVCEYILFEESMYAVAFKEDYPGMPEDSLAVDAKNIRDGKLQNVAITIDKVQHVLQRMETNKPPIRTLSVPEIYSILWVREDSIKDGLIKVL